MPTTDRVILRPGRMTPGDSSPLGTDAAGMGVIRGALPARSTTIGVLYESGSTRVTAGTAIDGSATIRKEGLGPGGLERTRHEARILRRLAGVPGVVQLTADCGPDEIVMPDRGGTTLAALIDGPGALEPDHRTRLSLAVDLARAVAAVHRAGVVHRDLNPANVLVGPASGAEPGRLRPTLIDFHLAGTFVQDVPGFAHHRRLVGTMPYLAPEQTGRVGTVVDERADLYGLGATLYELCTGQPPFPVTDPLSMVHNTLTRPPVPPVEHRPDLPPLLSQMIVMLLEKEPDRRYQSAAGLAHDLARLLDGPGSLADRRFPLGERDFPSVLRPPARLVGRDAEIDALRAAFGAALSGAGARALVVSGSPGVGKSALVDQLRATVTERCGWFVTGKFDQYRQDLASSAPAQAVRALGRLLLAGDDAQVADARAAIADAVGPNLPLLLVLPEYAALLDRPQTDLAEVAVGDATELDARQAQTLVDLLGAVASPAQPLIMVLDDIQWAGNAVAGLLDAVLRADERLNGVFLVAAHRDGDIGPTHPLAAAVDRWEGLDPPLRRIHVENLPATDLRELLAGMLRLPVTDAAGLAAVIGERTDGNPFDTVELVNAVRRDGGLALGPDGWSWDSGSIRAFVGDGDVVGLLRARIDRLPAATAELVEMLACLGGEVTVPTLGTAAGRDEATVREQLLPALEDGLLVAGSGNEAGAHGSVRFRHDRVQQAAHRHDDPRHRRELNLAMARRLAPAAEAAERYLEVVEAADAEGGSAGLTGDETDAVAALFVRVAPALRTVDLAVAERLVGAAVRLLDGRGPGGIRGGGDPGGGDPGGGDTAAVRAAAERLWHTVLCDRGRFDEADAVYRRLVARTDDLVELAEPTSLQVASLTARARPVEAVALGLGLLRRFGLDVPGGDTGGGDPGGGEIVGEDFGPAVGALFAEARDWAAALDLEADLRRPEPTDARVPAIARVMKELLPVSFYCHPLIAAWLMLTGCRQWREHGPCAPQMANVGCTPMVAALMEGDFGLGYRLARHALAVGEARGYEPQTSTVRHLIALGSQHWFEPLDTVAEAGRRAREGLVRGGDLQDAAFTYQHSLTAHLDCAPSLETGLALADTAVAFCRRIGHDQARFVAVALRQFVRALRGDTRDPGGGFDDDELTEAGYLAAVAGNPMAAGYFRVYRALSAALHGDGPGLIRHAAEIEPLLPFLTGCYPYALAALVRGLALALRARESTGVERAAVLTELAACRDWLAARAVDAPANFAHLVTLLEAERAWAEGDRWTALSAFEGARRLVAATSRPWHEALITERAALFALEHGLVESGPELLARARQLYAAWCADGKVRRLDAEHPLARVDPVRARSRGSAGSHGSADSVDLMAVLHSSQALGSETSLSALRIRVGEVLGAMTGATGAVLVLRDGTGADRLVWDTTDADSAGVPLGAAGHLLPLSALRYAERTGTPVVIHDAADERFAADPYLRGRPRCSLLLVPLLRQGVLCGVLVLENRDRVGAFTDQGLDAVQMVSGQLVASLENAQLYASLEQNVADRTRALQEANSRLEVLSLTDALTGLPNRRQFDLLLESEMQRARRQGQPLGLAMIDVDRFKAFNDHYGHPAGDECLRVVAHALRGSLREATDAVCRYGGEEFALLLPGTAAPEVRVAADRARAAVEGVAHPHARSPQGVVTVSIGVASMADGDDGPELTARADEGLYVAKRNGRNQVGTATCAGACCQQVGDEALLHDRATGGGECVGQD